MRYINLPFTYLFTYLILPVSVKILVAARKENCVKEPLKTIESVRISKKENRSLRNVDLETNGEDQLDG